MDRGPARRRVPELELVVVPPNQRGLGPLIGPPVAVLRHGGDTVPTQRFGGVPTILAPNEIMIGIQRFVIWAVVCGAIACPASMRAQQSTTQLSLDATIGRSFGNGGGDRTNRNGPALDALLAWRPRGAGLHGVLGIGTGVQGRRGADTCLAIPGSTCVADYPRIYTLGILLGLEERGKLGAARLLAGPTHFRVDGGGGALGGQARLELVSPSLHRIALVGSARYGMVWHLDRQDYQLGAVSIGLGIY